MVEGRETASGLALLFQRMLQEMYWCERHLRDVLDNMAVRASTDELKSAFRAHQVETGNHVNRLEKIFYQRDMAAQPLFCVGMQGLFDEGWQVINETAAGSAHRDAVLIVAAQKVEHYEIATYGSLCALAKILGYSDAAGLLRQTLAEEKKTDGILTELAEKDINVDASIESVSEDQLPLPETGSVTTESDPAVNAMKEATTGLDAGAGSKSIREGSEATAPGSADALLVNDSGQPKGKKKKLNREQ